MITSVLILALLTAAYAEDVPANLINVCSKDNSEMNQCLLNSTKLILPKFFKGLPEYNISTMDPMLFGNMVFNTLGLNIRAINVLAHELSKSKVRKIQMVEFGKTYKLGIDIPKLNTEGDYNVDGNYLLFPLNVTGRCNGNFTDLYADVTLHFDNKMFKGQNHKILTKIDFTLTVKNGRVTWGNLVGIETPTLAELMNETVNQSFHEFAKEMLPACEKILARVFRKNANKILSKFTAEQLFPTK